jgi:hypothetical protein
VRNKDGKERRMTRLIDADKIKYTSIAHLASYPVAPSPCDTVMRAEINAMPTVDAIPVEWIESQVDKGKWAELVQRWAERKEE